MDLAGRTRLVREEALRLGFEACGFSRAEQLQPEAKRLEEWLLLGRHGSMTWMEEHFDKRIDPRQLVPGARTVISVIRSYYDRETAAAHPDLPYRISKYALGEDYHTVVKDGLHALHTFITAAIGPAEGRAFVDSAPVMDKAWAVRSGIGWQGKNANLITKRAGSFFFIGELILDMEFEYDTAMKDLCGSCRRCIDACPTEAIVEPYKVDGSKCISYFTIELRDEIPAEVQSKLGSWMYGCDVCQDVCPWNRIASEGTEPRLKAREPLLNPDPQYWEGLGLEEYRKLFKGSAVKRAKFDGLRRNIEIVKKNRERSGPSGT